jgi:broad specificity phosphatase PhoE
MSQSQSPITGIIDESIVILDFGKHEGKSVKEISSLDPEFYGSLVDEKGEGVYAIRRHRDKTFRLYLNPLAQMDQ